MSVIGYTALLLALVASLFSAVVYAIGHRRNHEQLLLSARTGLLVSCGLVTIAVLALMVAIFTHDFGLQYVYNHTTRNTPFLYLLSALWSGEEGSLLFWAWLTAIFATIIILQKRDKNLDLVPYATSVILISQAFFLLLLLTESNPFVRLGSTPADGTGLNPLLENPGNIIHPPLLLAGYVGLTIPFAFAVSALFKGKFNNDWLSAARGWALLAWLLLGAGNIIGAWWAYVELGWGGYWAWDPVENAGLMPWLLATVLLHSMVIQRQRNTFKVWTLSMAWLAFILTVLGTFINRSGITSSVHSFPVEGLGPLGPYFLVFLGAAILVPFWLLWQHRHDLKSEYDTTEIVSRDSSFLFNNILLAGITLIVLVGTLFPTISEAIRGVRVEVGEDFFNRVGGPIFLAIILLAGLCTLIGWRLEKGKAIVRKIIWPLALSIVLIVVLLIFGVRQWFALTGFFICAFTFFAVLYQWLQETRAYSGSSPLNFFKSWWHLLARNRPRYGAYLVHLSIIIMAVGIIGSSFFKAEEEFSLQRGDSATIEGYTLVSGGLETRQTPERQYVTAPVMVYNGSRLVKTMTPELFYTRFSDRPVSEVAIRSTLREDLYIVLGGYDLNNDIAVLSVRVNPLVIWLWIGGGVFILGGLVAFWPTRRQSTVIVRDTTAAKTSELEDEIEKQVRELRGRQTLLKCPECGTPHNQDDRFCSQCGANLGQGEPQ